jgi:regulator of protease activity HflC (stomatin/prohibitin superfamily)
VGLIYRVWSWFLPVPKRQLVRPFQSGVVLRDGGVEKVLTPGSYWITPKRALLLCDMRPTPFQVPAQELLTTDGLAVKISLGGEYRITDPAAFLTRNSDSFGAFYLEVRQALHAAVRELDGKSFLGEQSLLATRVKELVIPAASQLGLELTRLELFESAPIGWTRQV